MKKSTRNETPARPGFHREKVCRHDHFPMLAKELLPGGLAIAFRCRFQAVLLQDVGDGAVPDFMAQVGQCSLDSPVTPIPVLGGHADHQSRDLISGAWTAWASLIAAIIFPGDQPAMPSQERCWRHDGRQLMKPTPAQLLGPHRQAPGCSSLNRSRLAPSCSRTTRFSS